MRMLRGRKRTANNPDLETETQEEFDARFERNKATREANEQTEKRAGVERRKTERRESSERRHSDAALIERENAYAARSAQ